MSLVKVEDLDHPPVIGEMYLVRCILQDTNCGGSRWLPIFGIAHADDIDASDGKEDIAGMVHYHNDTRFFTADDFAACGFPDNALDAIAVKLRQGKIDPDSWYNYQIEHRPLECLREWPAALWPTSKHLRRFERRYSKVKLDLDCMKCPHQGADLRGVKPIDGTVLCPLHRLLWDAKDGSLIRTK